MLKSWSHSIAEEPVEESDEEQEESDYEDTPTGPQKLRDRSLSVARRREMLSQSIPLGSAPRVIQFHPIRQLVVVPQSRRILPIQLTYRFYKTTQMLIKCTLEEHGFQESTTSDFDVMWGGCHLPTQDLQHLRPYQMVNHFPRTGEMTRKDRLAQNIRRMEQNHGHRHFSFVPEAFCLPSEGLRFQAAASRDRKAVWIVKPNALSRGRGIYLVESASEVPTDKQCLVGRYIMNPLLVDGFKFDLRIYVALTSVEPLRLYIYKEGLARFATERFSYNLGDIDNLFMHLTNYSINKYSENFVTNEDPEVDNYGNKWSLSALWEYLRQIGIDTDALWKRITDLVVKTFISVESIVHNATKMFVPGKNCFELFGFDVLIDDELRPWLLEVNLSPSLGCDSPLDVKIKGHMIADLFNMVGFKTQRTRKARRLSDRPDTAADMHKRIFIETRDEYERRGDFDRVYPDVDSHKYDIFFESARFTNQMLHKTLYPSISRSPVASSSSFYISLMQRSGRPVELDMRASADDARRVVPRQPSAPRTRGSETVRSLRSSYEPSSPGSPQRSSAYSSLAAAYGMKMSAPVTSRASPTLPVVSARSPYQRAPTTSSYQDEEPTDRVAQYTAAKALQRDLSVAKTEQTAEEARETFILYLDRVRQRLLQRMDQGSFSKSPLAANTDEQARLDLVEQFVVKVQKRNRLPLSVLPISSPMQSPYERAHALVGALERFVELCQQDGARLTADV